MSNGTNWGREPTSLPSYKDRQRGYAEGVTHPRKRKHVKRRFEVRVRNTLFGIEPIV